MKNKVVHMESIKEPICQSDGFAKKLLSHHKLDIMGLCGFGCRYCSSNWGNFLRINRRKFAIMTEKELGEALFSDRDPSLTFIWVDIIEKLETQLRKKRRSWGRGRTLVFSMLTDGFSPMLVDSGITRQALELILAHTSFRIRVLTKNAVVGSKDWIEFFKEHPDRFVVGLSTGTTDDIWAKRVELGTPSPTERLEALRQLQEASIPTYGMLCPIFPDVLEGNRLDDLVSLVEPSKVEHMWAEPFNDRMNWEAVRHGYDRDSNTYHWFTEVYEQKSSKLWSSYAMEVYRRLYLRAKDEGWLHKLRYLLYEGLIEPNDAEIFRETGFSGVLLQGKVGDDGLSKNIHVAAIQSALK